MAENDSKSHSSTTTLSRSVQELDAKIVASCNELMRMKAHTPRMVVDNSNERARMKRECEQREGLVIDRLRRARFSKELSMYREVCDNAFAELGLSVPAIVDSRQAQLLLHVHLMTILDNQTELLEKHKRMEALRFQEEISTIQQEQCMNENRILRSILDLESQIKDLEDQLASCPLRTENNSTRGSLLRKREGSSSSNDTLDTVSSDFSRSFDDENYLIEFVPPLVQSPGPRLSAPSRPRGLAGLLSTTQKAGC